MKQDLQTHKDKSKIKYIDYLSHKLQLLKTKTMYSQLNGKIIKTNRYHQTNIVFL